MQPRILDGKALAGDLRERIKSAVSTMSADGLVPGLATILVGNNPASVSYVRSKHRTSEEVGIRTIDVTLPEECSAEELSDAVAELNERSDVHGILIQQPLPAHLDAEVHVAAVAPAKDVDGFHPENLGRLVRGRRCMVPCTPLGVVHMLAAGGISTRGANVVIVGRSMLVGKPLASLLMQKNDTGNATVTVCHSATRDLPEHTRNADIVVAAIGVPGYVTADMVREGAVVIDVGINRVDDSSRRRGYRIVGDVDYDNVAPKTSAITPVPGGVGPMTVVMLMYNTVQAARGAYSQDPLMGEQQ
jgi:methylenetetrahydrofolate dehydrogenase (NADP+) / methenyltetrahydrofolate cyclohydrolase